jgi:hypothetical protein
VSPGDILLLKKQSMDEMNNYMRKQHEGTAVEAADIEDMEPAEDEGTEDVIPEQLATGQATRKWERGVATEDG